MTAVEWLFLMLNNPNSNQEFNNKLFEKAKEIEKQQIIEANTAGVNQGLYGYKNAEEYYNATFKKKKRS